MALKKRSVVISLFVVIIGLVAIAFLVYALLSSSIYPVVKTNVGIYQGVHATDGEYDMYLGIPYARVNASNVFGPAIPQSKLNTTFIADNDEAICPQFEKYNKIVTGTLDCLRLNIYTPKFTKTKHRHPVLVFIHGGDYKSGYGKRSLYGPKYLMRHGIVLVTMNYRLGPYGFICSNEPEISNQGYKDQILALKWIKENIAHFGGDNKKVTIAGVGSGGESVNLHLMYDKEELFQKAIIDSGIFDKRKEVKDISDVLELADELDFAGSNESEALQYLNAQNVKSVIATAMMLHFEYGPCFELDNKDAFITSNTSNKNLNRVPVLIGHSNKEMLREYAHRNLDGQDFRSLFKDELKRNFDLEDEQLRNMEDLVRHFYIGNETVSEKNRDKIIDFVSDIRNNYPTKRMIDRYFEDDPKAVFYNVFGYMGERNFAKNVYNISMDGTTRGDVLGYLFDTPYVKEPDAEDQLVIDYMTTMWINFAKYGNPTPVKTELLPIKWEPVAKDKLNYFEITSNLSNKITPFQNRTSFWDHIYQLNGMHERITMFVKPWQGNKIWNA